MPDISVSLVRKHNAAKTADDLLALEVIYLNGLGTEEIDNLEVFTNCGKSPAAEDGEGEGEEHGGPEAGGGAHAATGAAEAEEPGGQGRCGGGGGGGGGWRAAHGRCNGGRFHGTPAASCGHHAGGPEEVAEGGGGRRLCAMLCVACIL